MLKLSAFADEIGADLDLQIRVCKENAVTHIELRGVAGKNVMDFTPAMRGEIKARLAANSMGVVAIGSPIGKVAIDQPWQAHFDRFKLAVEWALYFNAPFIRVFSYYPPGGEGKGLLDPIRDQVIERFQQKVEYIKDLPITMVHENEKGVFGDIGRRCQDLLQTINSPKLRAAFDFANFVQVGDDTLANWAMLKPYTIHIHVKDAVKATGNVVLFGDGDGNIPQILKDAWDSGYRGFLTLEPHLKVAGHSHGETGPDLFKVAADRLKEICRKQGIALAGMN